MRSAGARAKTQIFTSRPSFQSQVRDSTVGAQSSARKASRRSAFANWDNSASRRSMILALYISCGRLTMRLSDAGLRCRQTKPIYRNHRSPPWPNEDATPRSLEPIVRSQERADVPEHQSQEAHTVM